MTWADFLVVAFLPSWGSLIALQAWAVLKRSPQR